MGVLPAQELDALISAGAIELNTPLGPRQLQPSSLDLTLSTRAWRVRASFLPSPGTSVIERLNSSLMMHEIDLGADGGAVLERGCVYLVELSQHLNLPSGISGGANPKSSTGRIDVFVRLVTNAGDRGAAFDVIPDGYKGPIYAEISPRTFSIIVREGSSLNQLRLKTNDARLDDGALMDLHRETPLIDCDANIEGGIGLTINLDNEEGPVGWRARRHTGLIDVDVSGAADPEDFFEPIAAPRSGFIILDPDEFYILASREALVIPPNFAAEMTPISPGLGEFRVHYAGFFDPGFGWSPDRALGSRAVLEVRSHDAPFVLEHGQLVARLVYERMADRPRTLYGEGMASNYQGQGLKLSKHFRS